MTSNSGGDGHHHGNGSESHQYDENAGATAARATAAVVPTRRVGRQSIHEQKISTGFSGRSLSAVPTDVLTLRNVIIVDLSHNQITRFPGAVVATELQRLEILRLQHNLLFVLEDILALSTAPRLRELDVRDNPLRLLSNRIYLLEVLFRAPGCHGKPLIMAHKDAELKAHGPREKMTYATQLPRLCGFPVLMQLNGEWITSEQIAQVEVERGHAIEYYKPPAKRYKMPLAMDRKKKNVATDRLFDGSRMTMKQMLRNEARSVAIPLPTVIEHYQFDVESAEQVTDDAPAIRPSTNNNNNIQDEQSQPTAPQRAMDKPFHEYDEPDFVRKLFRSQEVLKPVTTADQAPEETKSPKPATNQQSNSHGPATTPPHSPRTSTDSDEEDEELEPWSYPISTFDRLGSEDRHYVRKKSKQSDVAIERDDHFFDSSIFLDCVAQSEKSRRLTVRAVDLLLKDDTHHEPQTTRRLRKTLAASTSAPDMHSSTAASNLLESLNTKFSREIDRENLRKIEAFCAKRVDVNDVSVHAGAREPMDEIGDYFFSEHQAQRQRVNQMMQSLETPTSGAASTAPRGARNVAARAVPEETIEESLSRVKLRNAVDLANSLLDFKQERRMIQTLIDADEKVIEEERVAQEQASHRHRLHLIAQRKFHSKARAEVEELVHKTGRKHVSPWQERNWKAKEFNRQEERRASATIRDEDSPRRPSHLPGRRAVHSKRTKDAHYASASSPTARSRPAALFRTVETVEKAASDPLVHVNSHDLLVRCSEIRQHASAHIKALEQHRDHFLEEEAAWETMRHDPTNVLRRHLRRKLYQDAQEIQVGSTQYFYSPLFN
ncbi:TPA: hypothetical protein N0F65_009893 [Lagenidium giganteum]|uniref:Uncharacterized protein n=1 Tax=Lagenidium giganteum TaxID=4803 RepID=A0AAV2YRY2_9STRA|nr:TPA: hypothetical protein N0F65_009893 [Lagenidium giganteum]